MINIKIRKNSTGQIRVKKWELGFDQFIWEDGNFACDCNRGDFFDQAGGEDYSDHDCGHDEYDVNITDSEGVSLYKEY